MIIVAGRWSLVVVAVAVAGAGCAAGCMRLTAERMARNGFTPLEIMNP